MQMLICDCLDLVSAGQVLIMHVPKTGFAAAHKGYFLLT